MAVSSSSFVLASGTARADWEPSGALSASLLIDVAGDTTRLGGVGSVDLWKQVGIFRVGFVAGLGALSRGADEDNRVFAPLGLSMALRLGEGRVGGHLVARAGVWGGADFEGLDVGAFLTAGGTLDLRFEGGLALGVGVEMWSFFGGPTRVFVTPTLALRWNPTGE